VIRGYLAPDVILRFLINKDEPSVSMLDRAEAKEIELLTSVFSLYEAVSSIEKTDVVDIDMLRRLLKIVKISSEMEEDLNIDYGRFNEKRKQKLRSAALKEEYKENK